MKTINLYAILLTIAAVFFACDPIEDESLREKYYDNAGEPITKPELEKAISITQPVPNQDGVVAGDQYVVIKNNRPDIGGAWHIQTNIGEKILNTDTDTIKYEANGTYSIYFVGISANKIIQTDPVSVVVTNCFDPYMSYLSGAKDKADKTAKKTWKLLDHPLAFYNGMYGAWKYYNMVPGQSNYQGDASILTADDFGKYMVFEISGNKLTVYDKDGAVVSAGNWGFSHQDRGEGIQGELIVDKRLICSEKGWQSFSGISTPYYILSIDDNNMILCLPGTYNRTGDDWDYDASYYFFTVAE